MRRLQVSSGFQAERNRLLRLATVFCLLALSRGSVAQLGCRRLIRHSAAEQRRGFRISILPVVDTACHSPRRSDALLLFSGGRRVVLALRSCISPGQALARVYRCSTISLLKEL